MPAAKTGSTLEIIGSRHIDAFALDRLHDESGNTAALQRIFECGKIVEGNAHAIWQERPEAAAK
jgi:hypothetical protein